MFRQTVRVAPWALLLSFSTLEAQSNYMTPYAITTLAGNHRMGRNDGVALDARFDRPKSIARDKEGNLYVADSNNHTIRKITPERVVSTFAGLLGSAGSADGMRSAARFRAPSGIAIDDVGTLYVSDSENHTIRKITPEGMVSTLVGLAGSQGSANGQGSAARFRFPDQLAIDRSGTIYIADTDNHIIRLITPAGVATTLAGLEGNPGAVDGPASSAKFMRPRGIAVDSGRNVFVTDENHAIRRITPQGVVSTIAGKLGVTGSTDGPASASLFRDPEGLAFDQDGNLFVSTVRNSSIRKISPSLVVSTLAGSRTNIWGHTDGIGANALFNAPQGLVADGIGNIFVADTENHSIRKLDTIGRVTTWAGVTSDSGTDGPGANMQFNMPWGIAVDETRTVYVADTMNHTIRKISPEGIVTTIAGLAGNAGAVDGQGPAARFNAPFGVARDRSGNLYVSERGSYTVRKITPAGAVTTFAGRAGMIGSTDGLGPSARFGTLTLITVSRTGDVFVVDDFNHTVRKITPVGVVSTIAGTPGVPGNADGVGAAARFRGPYGITVDRNDNLYVGDSGNHTIRKITPVGLVTTIAGMADDDRTLDGVSTNARFNFPSGVAVDDLGNLYVAEAFARRVRRIEPNGVVTTLAGGNTTNFPADGVGAAARFTDNRNIAVGANGHIYLTDYATIRVGLPAPVTTVAGTKLPTITIPPLLPSGATSAEARALAEQPNGGVLIGVSGVYPGGANNSSQVSKSDRTPTRAALSTVITPNYSNPQPYTLSQVVRLLSNGQPDPSFTRTPGGDGTINALAIQPSDGRILVGGTFTTFNAVPFRNVARLRNDGTADPTFIVGSGADAQVNTVAVQTDGRIIIGGAFQNVAGQSRPFLARLMANGALDSTFTPAVNGTVNAIAIDASGRILIGGAFTTVSGTTRMRIARLLATGTLDSTFDPGAGASDEVVALFVQPNGTIVAAGDFTSFAGQPRSRVIRLLTTGAIDSEFSTSAAANNAILSLGLQSDGRILLGGSFTEVNGSPRARLARLNANGTLDTTFDPGTGANSDIRALLPRSDGTVFLAGLFSQYQGNTVPGVVAILGNAATTNITSPPKAATSPAGTTARFVAEATGTGVLSYQWYKNGVSIPGATDATLTVANIDTTNQGTYTVQVTSSTGSSNSSDTTLTVTPAGVASIVNLAGRADAGSGDTALVTGFVISGTGRKQIMLRAAGPALTPFGVGGVMPNPRVRLFRGADEVSLNRDWDASLSPTVTRLAAFPFPANSLDAGLLTTLEPGGYTAIVDDESSRSGVVLAEAYDADPDPLNATARLANLSLRARVGAGDKVLIPGVVVSGNIAQTLLFRGIGPRLTDFGLPADAALADPTIKLTRSDGSLVAENDDWSSNANAPEVRVVSDQVGAFSLPPGARDSALLVTLPPGAYTLTCSGKGSAEGIALVEVYFVP